MLKLKRHINLNWGDIDMPELDLFKLIVNFAQTNKAEGKSPKTVAWYGEMLRDFTRFLESTGTRAVLDELNVMNVREFIINEQGRPVSPYTVQGKVRALKAFSSWLSAEGYLSHNLLTSIRLPKVPSKLIEPLTPDEIDSLMKVQNPLTAIGSRNIAILTTFLGAGIRESELSNLPFSDTHIEEGFLKVVGKGAKERILPIGAVGQKVLWLCSFQASLLYT